MKYTKENVIGKTFEWKNDKSMITFKTNGKYEYIEGVQKGRSYSVRSGIINCVNEDSMVEIPSPINQTYEIY